MQTQCNTQRAIKSSKTFVAAVSMLAAFGFTSSQALSADSNLGLLVPTAAVNVAETFSGLQSGSFLDTHTFQVASTASLEGLFSAINFQAVGIANFMAALWLNNTELKKADILTIGNATTASLGYMPLLAVPGNPDPYEIRISGIVDTAGGAYSGSMVVAPVPEPEIYAMMGIGIALIGWAGRKQKQRQKPATA